MARAQGSEVPTVFAIHSGGWRLTESITQPTSKGGIRSRILFRMLLIQDQVNNF